MRDRETKGLRTWIEVSKKAIKNNYNQFRKLIKPGCKLMAVAKSNAYGHGLVDFAREMQKLGADWIGVDSITEASRLRKEGIVISILVLGYTLPENYAEALANNISLTISTSESLESLKQLTTDNRPLAVHLKLDTGMHRQGFQLDQIEEACRLIQEINNYSSSEGRSSQHEASNNKIIVEGVYTHFAAAKNPAFPADTQKQIGEFEKAVTIFHTYGFKPIRHAAATSGAIVFPSSHFDMIRIGIGLYGLWPSIETKACFEKDIKLIPALTWKTIVSEIKILKKGERVGYDFSEILKRDSKIAILPVGYWHGYRRNLSSIGHAVIKNQKAKILGRVTMDMIVVDITDIKNVKLSDEVVLLGQDISAYELAQLSDTSWYETITQINPLIKRVYE